MLTLPLLDPVNYHRDTLPELAAGPHGAAAAAAVAGLPPLGVNVEGNAWTYRANGNRIEVSEGIAADVGPVLELDTAAYSDLMQLVRTVPALMIAGELQVTGGSPALDRWERALRTLCHGVPIAEPEINQLGDVDIAQTFTLADSD